MDEAHGHHDDFPTLSIDEHKNDHTAEACYSDEPNMSFGTTTVTDALDQEALTSSPKFNIDVNNKHHDDEGEIVSDTEEKESINHKPVFPDSNVEEDFSPKSKKSALDDLRNMKFAKKDPFNEASAFRLTRPSTNSDGKSSLRGVNDREYKDHSRHRTRREHTDTRKRSRSRNSQRIEDDIDRQHRSTMFLLRNEQHASQIKNSDFKNVSSSGAISNIKHRLDSFLSMPEERVFALSDDELKLLVLQGFELFREQERVLTEKNTQLIELDSIISKEREMFESVTRDVYPQYNTSADKIARPSTQERSLNFAQQGGIINNQVFSLLANKSEMNVHARTQSFFPQALPHQSLSICHMATKPDLSVPPPVLQHASQTPRTTNNQGMGINFSSNDSSRFGAFSGSPMATNLNLQPPTLPLPFQHKKNVSSTSIPPLSVGQSSVSSTLTTPTLPLNASPASIVMSSAQTMPNQNQLQLSIPPPNTAVPPPVLQATVSSTISSQSTHQNQGQSLDHMSNPTQQQQLVPLLQNQNSSMAVGSIPTSTGQLQLQAPMNVPPPSLPSTSMAHTVVASAISTSPSTILMSSSNSVSSTQSILPSSVCFSIPPPSVGISAGNGITSSLTTINFSQPPPNFSQPPPSVQQQQQITNQQNVLKLHHIPDLSIPPPNLSQRQFQAPNQLPLGGLQQNIISSSTLAAALDLGGSFQVQSSSASMQRISGGGSPFKMKEAPSSCKVALRPLMSLNISLPDLKKLHPKGQKRTPTKGRQMQSKNGQDGPRNKYFRTPRRRKLPDSVSFSRQKLDEDEPSVQVASSSANVDLFIDPTVMVSSDGIISSTITEKNEACSSSNDNAMLTDVEQADSFHKEESGGSMLMEDVNITDRMTQQEDAGESLLSIMESQIPDTTLTSDI